MVESADPEMREELYLKKIFVLVPKLDACV